MTDHNQPAAGVALKACPFCGCAPSISEYECNADGDKKFAVACDCRDAPECHAFAERYVNVHGHTQAEAITAWNTRAPTDEGGAVLEANIWADAIETAARRVEKINPPPAGGPFSHTNTIRVVLSYAVTAIRALSTAALPPAPQSDQIGDVTTMIATHPDDLAVDRFAAAMKVKLAKKRADGRGGWEDKAECSAEFLSGLLRGHVEKGDPLDVGNLAMMLHQRGDGIAAHPASDESDTATMNGCEAPEVALARYIEILRADEGDSVTICCDNPEASSADQRLAIDCNGAWTDFKDRRFTGQSTLQCLAQAVIARGGSDAEVAA